MMTLGPKSHVFINVVQDSYYRAALSCIHIVHTPFLQEALHSYSALREGPLFKVCMHENMEIIVLSEAIARMFLASCSPEGVVSI